MRQGSGQGARIREHPLAPLTVKLVGLARVPVTDSISSFLFHQGHPGQPGPRAHLAWMAVMEPQRSCWISRPDGQFRASWTTCKLPHLCTLFQMVLLAFKCASLLLSLEILLSIREAITEAPLSSAAPQCQKSKEYQFQGVYMLHQLGFFF